MKLLSAALWASVCLAAVTAFPGAASATLNDSKFAAVVTDLGGDAYTFEEVGFAGGATMTGSFSGPTNGGYVRLLDLTSFSGSFSGGGGVPAFTIALSDLIFFDYKTSIGAFDVPVSGPDVGNRDSDILSVSPGGVYIFAAGPGIGSICDGVGTCGEINFPTGSPAPEPSAWALMLIGFAAVGGAMRRRVSTALA